MEPTGPVDGLVVHVWFTDAAGEGIDGIEVEVVLSGTGSDSRPVEVPVALRTGADGFGVVIDWGDPFRRWPNSADAVFQSATHPDYELVPPESEVLRAGAFWFPTGCCETESGAADYGVRHVAWCPREGLSRIGVKVWVGSGQFGPVEWWDPGDVGPVVPQHGYLDYDGVRWLRTSETESSPALLIDEGAMIPCPDP